MVFGANHIHEIVLALVDGAGFYNWFPPLREGTQALDAACALLSDLCENFVDIFIDESIDNVPRLEFGLQMFPSGQTYRTFVYYSQAIRTGNFTLYDYGPIKN
mmetsp:Transcript_39742/g.52060  ORF Transcript_39742/g.52060 Transcript_39742/m.52060 type:complete len:103 (+) Transcript_39742:671-979(+)